MKAQKALQDQMNANEKKGKVKIDPSSLAFARSSFSYFFSYSGVNYYAGAASAEIPPTPPSSDGGPSSEANFPPFLACYSL